ncbi:transporter substrate-binding domain-containing protein [uncultured Pseudodesulfovibrio sp.]|uniref:transporter substrate-binding domain-containing protein n=1 Tax=uncultured Pseudodesulfovibrio sp. TaxID=2035858 RepID=UPI0029C93DBF|nr:transporter substrate-binding domain-containing protein [uncultured Pseudodesulfovibrio sp.]
MISLASKNRLAVVYQRAGVPVEFVPLPQKRSLVLAVEGRIDGDAGRIFGLEKQYPTMARVDVKLLDFNGAAYVLKGRGFKRFRPEMLDKVRVGALSGVVWAENIMQGRRLELINTYEGLFGMLLEGRIDIALSSRLSAESVFSCNPGRYSRVQRLEPYVFKTSFYHYLNTKNADLVPVLEKALRELRAEDYWRDGTRAD